MKIQSQGIYNCTPKEFFEQTFNEKNRAERETKGCRAISYRVLSSDKDDRQWRQVAEVVDKIDAPGAIRKVFGETTTVEETSIWTVGTDTIKVSYKPDKMPNKITMQGEFRVTPHGDGSCKVIMDLEITVKIFGIGGMMEKLIAKELPEHMAKDVAYFNANMT